jgi:hypothetical protein
MIDLTTDDGRCPTIVLLLYQIIEVFAGKNISEGAREIVQHLHCKYTQQ